MRRTFAAVLSLLAYGYSVFPIFFIPVHAVFLQPPGLVLVFNFIFASVLATVPLLLPIASWKKKLVFAVFNTVAFAVSVGVILTGDLPSPMALSTAAQTDLNEVLSLLNTAGWPAALLIFSWVLQLGVLACGGPAPTIRFEGKYGRFGNLLFVLLALPAAVSDLSLSYPAALPGMAEKAWSYLTFKNLVPPGAVPDVRPLDKATNELMVLVIGESSSADYWQIGGNKDQTSPLVVARQAKGEIVYLSKHMSASQVTFLAVPNILTPFGKLEVQSNHAPNPSIVSLMNKAGRRTAWFSTQSPMAGSTEATDIGFREGNFSFLTLNNLDEGMLPDVEGWLQKYASVPGFMVMHTQGSHIPFELRYPAAFRKWPVVGGNFPTSQSEGNYKNSILYTDHILDELMTRLEAEKRPTILVYVADHGESVMRQGQVVRTSAPLGPNILHVPVIFWANALWRTEHADRWAALQAKSQTSTHHLNLGPTLIHLAGYTSDSIPKRLDLLSPGFEPWKDSPVALPGAQPTTAIAPLP